LTPGFLRKTLACGPPNKLNRRQATMHWPNQKALSWQALLQLSPQKVESAWKWLDNPTLEPPPEELQELTPLEWYLLNVVLDCLKAERELYPLQ
jgi:predicted lipoprotein